MERGKREDDVSSALWDEVREKGSRSPFYSSSSSESGVVLSCGISLSECSVVIFELFSSVASIWNLIIVVIIVEYC